MRVHRLPNDLGPRCGYCLPFSRAAWVPPVPRRVSSARLGTPLSTPLTGWSPVQVSETCISGASVPPSIQGAKTGSRPLVRPALNLRKTAVRTRCSFGRKHRDEASLTLPFDELVLYPFI